MSANNNITSNDGNYNPYLDAELLENSSAYSKEANAEFVAKHEIVVDTSAAESAYVLYANEFGSLPTAPEELLNFCKFRDPVIMGVSNTAVRQLFAQIKAAQDWQDKQQQCISDAIANELYDEELQTPPPPTVETHAALDNGQQMCHPTISEFDPTSSSYSSSNLVVEEFDEITTKEEKQTDIVDDNINQKYIITTVDAAEDVIAQPTEIEVVSAADETGNEMEAVENAAIIETAVQTMPVQISETDDVNDQLVDVSAIDLVDIILEDESVIKKPISPVLPAVVSMIEIEDRDPFAAVEMPVVDDKECTDASQEVEVVGEYEISEMQEFFVALDEPEFVEQFVNVAQDQASNVAVVQPEFAAVVVNGDDYDDQQESLVHSSNGVIEQTDDIATEEEEKLASPEMMINSLDLDALFQAMVSEMEPNDTKEMQQIEIDVNMDLIIDGNANLVIDENVNLVIDENVNLVNVQGDEQPIMEDFLNLDEN